MRFLVLFVFSALLAFPALAQTTTEIEAAKLVETIRLVDSIKARSDLFAAKIVKDKSKNMPPMVQQKMDPLVREELQASITRNQEAFKSDMAASMARHFTLDEIREMNVFFATPTGQKLATQWPAMQPEIEEAAKKWSKKVEAEVMAGVMTRLAMGK